MTMFNPDDYRSTRDSGKPTKPQRLARKSNKAEEGSEHLLDPYWHVFTTIEGPVQYVHRIDLSGRLGGLHEGTAITMCDIVGRLLYTCPIGTLAFVCPECHRRRPNRPQA